VYFRDCGSVRSDGAIGMSLCHLSFVVAGP
jgi:hypothetical protein